MLSARNLLKSARFGQGKLLGKPKRFYSDFVATSFAVTYIGENDEGQVGQRLDFDLVIESPFVWVTIVGYQRKFGRMEVPLCTDDRRKDIVTVDGVVERKTFWFGFRSWHLSPNLIVSS